MEIKGHLWYEVVGRKLFYVIKELKICAYIMINHCLGEEFSSINCAPNIVSSTYLCNIYVLHNQKLCVVVISEYKNQFIL